MNRSDKDLPDDALELLGRVPYFSQLSPTELAQVQRRLVPVACGAGEIIFSDGEACTGMFIVIQGQVRIVKSSAEGREQVLLVAGPGASFNEVPVFDGGPNPAAAEAMEPTALWMLPKDDFLDLVKEYPAMALGVLRAFAGRLRRLTMLVEDLSFRRVTSRVAKTLLQMAEEPQSRRRLTQQQMAALVGTSREVVGRSLKELERDGLIRFERNRILVLRPEALREII